ncbi:phage tail assembly protein [Caballeronia sp. AZ10_KS36]|uniref:phage tail assembly protein n=1 Tax=Caballeronia sp. AZ10_KS36 TaxID=2921757 RepID=UPI00202955E5|nr:phage tail assembly protein [Caballeronia sp. AZ10_KS36]
MSDSKVIQLRKPVTVGKDDAARTFDSISLREPRAGEFESAEKMAMKCGYDVALVSLVSGVPVDAVDLMGVTVVDEAMDYFATFAPEGMGEEFVSEDEFRLELRAPAKVGDGDDAPSYAALNLSEPTNLQRRKAGQAGGAWATVISLVSRNAGVPVAAVRSMCARDFLEAAKYFKGFQGRHKATSDND